MQIESIIKRPQGHDVTLDRDTAAQATYQFRPENDYIVEVENTDHIQRFLCIKEGYRIPKAALAAAVTKTAAGPGAIIVPPKAPAATDETVGLVGSSVHPSLFDINGTQYQLGEVVSRAFAASGMTVESWNGLDAEVRHGLIDDELTRIDEGVSTAPAPAAATGELSEDAERTELSGEYQALFGKLPPKSMKLETIRTKIAEAKAPQA